MKDNTYRPEDDGKPDFVKKVKGVTTFSDREYFNTVFISGDDMDAEIKALKQKEIDDFNAKVVVESKTFKVNTRVLESEQMDKYKSMREDKVNKIGLRLAANQLKELHSRQILATKITPLAPVSAFALEEYKPDELAIKPLKGIKPNFEYTPLMADGSRTTTNFNRFSRQGITQPNPLSRKNFISPLSSIERTGPRWGKV